MPAAAERTPPGALATAATCGRPLCCRQPGEPLPVVRPGLAYGLPTLSALASAGLAAAVGLPEPVALLLVLVALTLSARLAGRLASRRPAESCAADERVGATAIAPVLAKELACP